MADRNVPRRADQHLFRGPAASGLGGTRLIADHLYLLSHDDRTGRPSLGLRPLSIGLGGALLAELMLGDSIGLQRDSAIVARRRWPADDLGRRVRDQVAAEREPHPMRDWLLFLGRSAAEDVALRLEGAGYLRHVPSWVPGAPAAGCPLTLAGRSPRSSGSVPLWTPPVPSTPSRQPWPGWLWPAG
jgi:hypothetical protein